MTNQLAYSVVTPLMGTTDVGDLEDRYRVFVLAIIHDAMLNALGIGLRDGSRMTAAQRAEARLDAIEFFVADAAVKGTYKWYCSLLGLEPAIPPLVQGIVDKYLDGYFEEGDALQRVFEFPEFDAWVEQYGLEEFLQ